MLSLLLTGLSEKEVAFYLGISAHTVHIYVKVIHRYFSVNSRNELFARLFEYVVSHFCRKGLALPDIGKLIKNVAVKNSGRNNFLETWLDASHGPQGSGRGTPRVMLLHSNHPTHRAYQRSIAGRVAAG